MNSIKRLLGIFWIVLAPSLVVFLIRQASGQIAKAAEGVARTNLTLQWGIILVIFIPISIGLMIFGYYAYHGDYDHLPENSEEL